MTLPLDSTFRYGVQTIHRRTEPAEGPWRPDLDDARRLVERVDELGFDSMWVGDHVAFTIPILDPLLQLAQASAFSRRLTFGTGIYLLPLRHPTPAAKMAVTLDHLTEGRFIFGVGVGGEFPGEFAACGVPHKERGARLNEALDVVRKHFSDRPVSHDGKFYPFPEVHLQPGPRQAGGPPIWIGGRSDAALARVARQGDGYFSYVITPEMYAEALDKIAAMVDSEGRTLERFDTGHLLFLRIDDTYEQALDTATETLSVRYGMDFRKPAQRYAALGTPSDVAAAIQKFHDVGLRHVVLDFVGPYEQRLDQIERFATDVRPLLS